MKSSLPFIAVVTLLFVVACEKQNTPPVTPPTPRSNPLVGKYTGEEKVGVLSHVLPPIEAVYPKTIEVYEENGQILAKDDSITVVLDNKGYYNHKPTHDTPGDGYTYIIEIRNDSLFKHYNKFTGRMWLFSGIKQQ